MPHLDLFDDETAALIEELHDIVDRVVTPSPRDSHPERAYSPSFDPSPLASLYRRRRSMRRRRTAFRAEHEHHQQHCGPSRVCCARLGDCREIGISDPRLQVSLDSVRCFVVAPFDALASRFDKCRYATIGGRWPGHTVSLA